MRNREYRGCPILYQQGTRTWSGKFTSGTSQRYSEQAFTSPRPRRYIRPSLLWGPMISILSIWSLIGFRSILELPGATIITVDLTALFFNPRSSFSCRSGLQPSQDRPLQSGGLSPASLELGTYLYLKALREVPPHPFIVRGAARFHRTDSVRFRMGR